ncbi:MAG: helix-turn-helix transcriptional regulator [Clostridium sp.]|nr:helix-turn-helix transcriptional regulator [Clostridium sp.]
MSKTRVFQYFLKDARKALGISQRELAERMGTTFQNISHYELGKRMCTFDYGMELLAALNLSVILENNQIILKGDYENMSNEFKNKKYQKEDLDFINFNPKDAYDLNKERLDNEEKYSKEEFKKAFKKLDDAGFNVYCSRFLDERLGDADYYPVGEKLVTIFRDGKEIYLVAIGGASTNYFLFENFIENIKEKYPKEGAFIEKVLLFECLNHDKGHDIYDVFKRRKNISNISPMLDGYEDIIEEALDAKDYFFDRTEYYNPRELTISDMLGIYDNYSSNYPYFGFEMPDGTVVLSEESFEGHDIHDALNYAEEYFEDYNKYLEMYWNEDEREWLVTL